MASILDNAVLVGKETTYGTAATLTRAYEAKADTFKRAQEHLDSSGMRAGRHAQRADRSIPINMGGEGTISADILDAGFGLLFQSMLGSVSGPTQEGATDAYTSTFATTAADPDDSWTVQVLRTDVGGTTRAFTHKGSVVTGWTIAQDSSGLATVEFNFDFMEVVTDVSAGTPTYVEGRPYTWAQAAATWNGSAIDLTNFSLSGALGLNTDRRFLRGSANKKKPIRSAVPEFTGSAEMEFEGLTQYAAFVAGTVAPLVVTWTGVEIDTGEDAKLVIEMPAVQFTGESPEVATDALPKQSLPFKALHDGTDPAVTITYTSTDTAL